MAGRGSPHRVLGWASGPTLSQLICCEITWRGWTRCDGRSSAKTCFHMALGIFTSAGIVDLRLLVTNYFVSVAPPYLLEYTACTVHTERCFAEYQLSRGWRG